MIATITPDRGDREPFMSHCNNQLIGMVKVMTFMPIVVSHKPTSDKVDLIPRIKKGIEKAKELGIDNVVIIENDDYYTYDYLSLIDFDRDFFGWDNTTYYNIKTRRYQKFYHETHSSLFTTAFKISALDKFVWPPDEYLWLDSALWKYAKLNNKNWKLSNDENPCLGIKHGVGKCGGKGHTMILRDQDHNMEFLKSRVDSDSFEFYKTFSV